MIAERQLQNWASAPVATKFKYTHEEVRKALANYLPDFAKNNHGYDLKNENYEVYLQGSYANSTNITGESDVDIVIELNSIFSYDIEQLTEEEQQTFHSYYSNPSKYKFSQFKKDVFHSLEKYFSKTTLEYGAKSLKIPKNSSRVNADVIPAFHHRKYGRFTYYMTDQYVSGIKLYNTDKDELIINYPKEHKLNCEALNHDTEGKFKDSIRIFKNFRKLLINKGEIDESLAPSYCIENLIYNCPAPVFNGSYQSIVINILQNALDDSENGSLEYYKCANGQDMLFLSPNTWDAGNAMRFITKCANLVLEKI
jgi:hypothetical protein